MINWRQQIDYKPYMDLGQELLVFSIYAIHNEKLCIDHDGIDIGFKYNTDVQVSPSKYLNQIGWIVRVLVYELIIRQYN